MHTFNINNYFYILIIHYKITKKMKAVKEVIVKIEFGWNFNRETEFGIILSQLPVNSLFEGIHRNICEMVREEVKVTKTALLSRLSKDEKSFINRHSK